MRAVASVLDPVDVDDALVLVDSTNDAGCPDSRGEPAVELSCAALGGTNARRHPSLARDAGHPIASGPAAPIARKV